MNKRDSWRGSLTYRSGDLLDNSNPEKVIVHAVNRYQPRLKLGDVQFNWEDNKVIVNAVVLDDGEIDYAAFRQCFDTILLWSAAEGYDVAVADLTAEGEKVLIGLLMKYTVNVTIYLEK